MPRVPQRDSHRSPSLRALRAAGGGSAGGVGVGICIRLKEPAGASLRYHGSVRPFFLVCLIGGSVLLPAAQPQKSTAHPRAARACGPLDGQSFRCPKFGFAYKVPFGWVDRTSDLQEDAQDAADKTAPRSGSETLLAVF